MRVELRVKDEFEAAHSLKGTMPSDSLCARLHGHRYEVEIACAGELPAPGFLVSYETMQEALRSILKEVDHTNLDDTLSPSTTEMLCAWLMARLDTTSIGPLLSEVKVQESSRTSCTVRRSQR